MRARRIAQKARQQAQQGAQSTQGTVGKPAQATATDQGAQGPYAWGALAICAALAALAAWLATPDMSGDPLLRQWVVQALEHRIGGDPRLLVGVDTPHGAVLPNPFTGAFWTVLALAWASLGDATAATLGAVATATAVWSWGMAARRVEAGLVAGATALLLFAQGNGIDLALGWALVGAGALAARHPHTAAPLAAAALWATAIALCPAWLWALPPLAALLAQHHTRTWRTTWAIALFLGGLVSSGTLMDILPWCLATAAVAAQGLGPQHGGKRAQAIGWLLGAGGAGAGWLVGVGLPWDHPTPHPPALLAAAVGAGLATAAILAWDQRQTHSGGTQSQGAGRDGTTARKGTAPRAWSVALASLAALALAGQAWTNHTPRAQGGMAIEATHTDGACPTDGQTVEALLAALGASGADGMGVRRVAAPAKLAWALLAGDMGNAVDGKGQGLSVVDAGLAGTAVEVGKANTAVVEEAKARWREGTGGEHNVGDVGNGTRSMGDSTLWRRSVEAVLVCGEEEGGERWEEVAGRVWMEKVGR
jgi:hypothetical protein